MPGLSATQITTFRARTYTCSGSAITGLFKKQSRETRVSLLPMLFLELSSINLEDEDNLHIPSTHKFSNTLILFRFMIRVFLKYFRYPFWSMLSTILIKAF